MHNYPLRFFIEAFDSLLIFFNKKKEKERKNRNGRKNEHGAKDSLLLYLR